MITWVIVGISDARAADLSRNYRHDVDYILISTGPPALTVLEHAAKRHFVFL